MKYAVISVSEEGARLGALVKNAINGEGTLYERIGAESGADAKYFRKTIELTAEVFNQFDGLLFIMASGIVVRAIAPYVVSKASDPAVLCMDECGKHCISLLSGHLGGANEWTREVSAAAGADPVITTATDVHHKKAPDDIARKFMMKVEPLRALKPVNSTIACGERHVWFLDMSLQGAEAIGRSLQKEGIDCISTEHIGEAEFEACTIISDNTIDCPKPHVFLRPKNLYVGIGCKRGTSKKLIKDAFEAALEKIGGSVHQVAAISSVDLKSDEKGLLDFVKDINVPIHFYKAEELKEIADQNHIEISNFVEKTIGVGNVCQSAALKEAVRGKTLLAKTKFQSVTIAIVMGLSGS